MTAPVDPVPSFGDKFRKARESKNLSLDDVSNVTKISARMLKAIEEEHFDQLPGGVFNKGFIRAYARHLSLDDEEAVTEYLAALRQAQVDAQNAWAPVPPPQKRAAPQAPPARSSPLAPPPPIKPPVAQTKITRDAAAEELPELQLPKLEHVRPKPPSLGGNRSEIPWKVPALVVLVILVGMIWWNRHSRSARAEGTAQPRTAASAPASLQPSTSASSANAARSGTVGSSAPNQHSPSRQIAAKPAAASASSSPSPESDSADENDVTTRNLSPRRSVTAAAASATPSLSLVIRASENSWVSVMADGKQVTEETLIAPAHTSARASREIIVRVGNAAGVSFLFNGKEFPAQGNESEVKTFVFDSAGMRLASATQTSDPAPQ